MYDFVIGDYASVWSCGETEARKSNNRRERAQGGMGTGERNFHMDIQDAQDGGSDWKTVNR
jgi:hypothetical protein